MDIADFIQNAINHYMEVTGNSREPKMANTPFCPAGTLLIIDYEARGELAKGCHSVVMKNMWVARIARPDFTETL